jgi:hypothetical protein
MVPNNYVTTTHPLIRRNCDKGVNKFIIRHEILSERQMSVERNSRIILHRRYLFIEVSR